MIQTTVPLLNTWQNFYVIVGSASAALTGLMFIVMTLMASRGSTRAGETTGTFATPTVVHLCAALLIAAMLTAPWPSLWQVGLLLGICGFMGAIYMSIVTWRAHHQTVYQPVVEDWLWHVILPFMAYAALVVAAMILLSHATLALFIVGIVTLLFLFIGIHNAWDTITYMTARTPLTKDEHQ